MMYKLIHNGMQISFPKTEEDALQMIEAYMSMASVTNKKICDIKITVGGKQVRLIMYEYYTLYREVFTIEED